MDYKIIWIFQILLALWFMMPAYMKLTISKEKMIAAKQLSPGGNPAPVRILGLLELLGIIGIIVPRLTGMLPVLTPITAVCFAIVMACAFILHLNKQEYKVLPMIVIAFILSLVVAWFRFAEKG